MLYLKINLAKGMSGLNAQELVIALSSIDAVSASISMAFSNKDVLAARKLVSFGFTTQLVAYIVQAVAFSTYPQHTKFQCGSFSATNLSTRHFSTPWWIYLSFRMAASILPCQVAYRLTSSLNKIENKNNASRSIRVKATALWRSLPATLTTSYLAYSSFVLLHGLSIFNILRGTNTVAQSWHSLTSEWGQSANAIIAVFAICHVVYAINRLFTAESLEDGTHIDKLSGRSLSRAYSQQGWISWGLWGWIKQRWPFHLGSDYSDHLLIDHSMLQRVLNPPLELDPVVRDKLWKELMDGFVYNDPDGILDCLDQGAPLDRPNDDGDYPIHLAARHNNTDILMRTRFTFTKDSVGDDPLLLKNSAYETPLEVACNANTLEAVRWIMEHLPQTHIKAKDAVRQAFRIAILGEKEGILRILQHLWPEWRALEIQSQSDKFSLLRFAINEHKAKSAYRLTDPAVVSRRQPNAHRIFELGWKLDLDDYSLETILDDRQDRLSLRYSILKLTHGVIGSSALDNDEKLELLLALNVDISIILRQSIAFAADQEFVPDRRGNMWEYILEEGYAFEPEDLDSILAFEIPAENSLHREAETNKELIRAALSLRGGRDWSRVVEASRHSSREDLEKLIMLEKDGTILQRMLNVKDKNDYSLVRFAISEGKNDPIEKRKQRLEYIDSLIQKGIEVTTQDMGAAHQCLFHHEGNLATYMLLASYTKHNVALSILHTICSESRDINGISASAVILIDILLRCGVDPTLLNESGKTPRIALRDAMAERPAKKISGIDEQTLERFEHKIRVRLSLISKLMLRWENHVKGSGGGNPLEMPDKVWVHLRNSIGNEETWAWLVEKNPEGYKVVEA